MELGEKLTNLKLDQTFLKELNEEDVEFAEKQFKKLYAQEMSKISYKMEKIQRVKQHLIDIESEQSTKQKQIKKSLDKKFESKQKNKDKYMDEKLKTYKIHQELWENKLQNIKRKNRQQFRQNCEQFRKYKDQVDHFWKTKTQEMTNLANKKKQFQARCQTFNRKQTSSQQKQKMKTQQIDFIPEIKRENTRNTQDYQKFIPKTNRQGQNKNIKFLTQNNHQHQSSSYTNHRKNDSNFTNKNPILSNRGNRDSKNTLVMPQMEQKKISQRLHVDGSKQKSFSQHYSQFQQFDQTKKQSGKDKDNQKVNVSFQKAMQKLDKIQKLKDKSLKKSQQKQTVLSPCQPRKPIDAQEYRLLRAKSQSQKQSKKQYTQENAESKERLYLQKNTVKFVDVKYQTASKQSRTQKLSNINQSRLSVSQNLQKQLDINSKQIQKLQECRHIRYKKDKILKAIRDKIFKIKLQEIQKLNKSRFQD